MSENIQFDRDVNSAANLNINPGAAPSINRGFSLPYTTPLLDNVRFRHGPRDLLGRFLIRAEAKARSVGIRLQIHRDFENLIAFNESAGAVWGESIVPILHPAYSNLDPKETFWISGHDQSGRIVSTQGARLISMPDTSLRDEFTSLRIFFADPETYLAQGTRCEVDCPAAEQITGRGVYSGAIWLHPEYRKTGISRFLARITRTLAIAEWDCEYVFSFLKKPLVGKNVQAIYGYDHCDPRFRLSGLYGDDLDLHLIWMNRQEMVSGLQAFLDDLIVGEERGTDDVVTNTSLPKRQGSISLS